MFLTGVPANKNCEKCGIPTQKRCGICPIDSDRACCSIECFNKHWDIHKDNFALLETFMLRFGDTFHDAQLLEMIDFRHFGSLQEKDSNKKFIFLHDTNKPMIGNVQDHFEKQGLIGDEFANYFSTGKCGLSSYGFASGLFLIKKKYNILYKGKHVTEIGVLDIEITKEYTTNVLVFKWPKKSNKKGKYNLPTKSEGWQFHWDVDNIHTKWHQVAYIRIEGDQYYTFDFTAAQYGIYTKFVDKYVHVENVTAGKCSYGKMIQLRVMDDE